MNTSIQGETVSLTCSLRGFNFGWHKTVNIDKWHRLPTDSRYEGRRTENISIKNVNTNDSGKYRCFANYKIRAFKEYGSIITNICFEKNTNLCDLCQYDTSILSYPLEYVTIMVIYNISQRENINEKLIFLNLMSFFNMLSLMVEGNIKFMFFSSCVKNSSSIF